MEVFGVVASVVTILHITPKVIEYLNDVKDKPKDCLRCIMEVSTLQYLLNSLKDCLKTASPNEPWSRHVEGLGIPNGPLDQYKDALEQMQSKLASKDDSKGLRHALLWKFKEKEVASILSRIERLKSLVQIALEMDHL